MGNKRNYIVLLFLIFIFISCDKRKNEKKEAETSQEKVQQTVFKEKTVEKIIDIFEKTSKKNRIEIGKFEKIAFENKDFYHAKVTSKENVNYTIGYQGVNAIGLFLKVGSVNGSELGVIEDMAVNLIQVSDDSITEEEARNLYTEILVKMGENEISSSLEYKNGIIYGIQIGKDSDGLIFSAQ